MDTIFFATGNEGKIKEAEYILGIKLKGISLEIDEIQSLNPIKVAVIKARDYFKIIKKPLFVEDVSLEFKALNELPGTYINDFLNSLGNEGLIKLLLGYKDRSAIAQTTLVYKDELEKEYVFFGRVFGKISDKARGTQGFGWDKIFIPKGSDKTFAEMNIKEKNKYSMRAKAFKKFRKYLEVNGKIKFKDAWLSGSPEQISLKFERVKSAKCITYTF